MRICHVITRLIIGGAQENTVLTCEGLRERGHDVVLVAGPETGPEGSLWPRVEASGLPFIEVPSLRRAIRPISEWRCLNELTRLFRRETFDIIHTHSSKAGIVGRLAAARAGVPIIVHTIHGMSFNRTQPWWMRSLYRSLERRAARGTTAFVSVADAMTEQAVAAGLAPRKAFTTVYSGMEVDRFGRDPQQRQHVRTQWGVAEDDVVVATIARLFCNKGYESILAAMPAMVARQPNLRFVWIGDGRHRGQYIAQLESLGLRDRVHLTGLVRPEEIPGLLTGADILLHASRWEGLPRALPQALLTEVPVISFDNDGAPEVVEPGVTGALVRLGDVDGLAQAVAGLAGNDEQRHRMGAEGRRRCLERFDHRTMVEQLDRLYAALGSELSTEKSGAE